MTRPIVTLTTDFGHASPYAAAMKGVILSINPDANVVDITHGVPHQDVHQGAIVLADVTPTFPTGAIHVAVIDPGVGSSRPIVYAEIAGQRYLAPDNGLLDRLALVQAPSTIVELADPAYWLPQVSATFHGRDILAPVAARLSLGLDPTKLGPPRRELVRLVWPEVQVSSRKIEGRVESIDSFGNLVTDITDDMLRDVPRGQEEVTIECDEHETCGIFRTYSDQPAMTLMALVGSTGRLELALVGDSAAAMLGVRAGTPVRIKW
jgi:S-adenosyl-L-methionine hydrolase (adenosine-forming)